MRTNGQVGSEALAEDLQDLEATPIPDEPLEGEEVPEYQPQEQYQQPEAQDDGRLPEFHADGTAVEYVDDAGNPIAYADLLQPGEEIAPPEPEYVAPKPTPVRQSEYTPPAPTYMTVAMAEEEKERIRDIMLTDPIAGMDAHAAFLEKQRAQDQAVTSYAKREIERKYPEFARVHSTVIDRGLSFVAPQERAASGEIRGILQAIGEEAFAHPKRDIIAVLERNLALMRGTESETKPAVQQVRRPALTPAQRNSAAAVPSGANRPAAAARGNSSVRRSNLSAGAQRLKDSGLHNGLSDMEYERAASAMKTRN